MNFRDWLLNEGQNINFSGWSKDGTITVYIDSTRYVFVTDAASHDRLNKLAKYKPWTALNEIKIMIKNNLAKQIEPRPAEIQQTPENKPMVQGTLF